MADQAQYLAAIDLGASNGKVVLGTVRDGSLTTQVIHRFEHCPRPVDGRLRWDWSSIISEIHTGLARAAEACAPARVGSISCSSWAQDFGLLDDQGQLFYPPVSYRDPRTSGVPDEIARAINPNALLERVGSTISPVTTLCQLKAMAAQERNVLPRARKLLFIADLVHHSLCGAQSTDWTMATASQLRHLGSGGWDRDLLHSLDIPSHFLPAISDPFSVLGHIPADNTIHPHLAGTAVISAAGHDTAAAMFCAGSMESRRLVLSLGTWGMLGCRTGDLLVPPGPADAGVAILGLPGQQWGIFKAGAGLWLIEECRRAWAGEGRPFSHEELTRAAESSTIESVIAPADSRFHAPGDMAAEIMQACGESGQPVPATPGEVARVIFDSLAVHYASGLKQLEQITGIRADSLQIVGGGSRNGYLCARIAEAARISIVAGPAEATATGNLMAQARASGIKVKA